MKLATSSGRRFLLVDRASFVTVDGATLREALLREASGDPSREAEIEALVADIDAGRVLLLADDTALDFGESQDPEGDWSDLPSLVDLVEERVGELSLEVIDACGVPFAGRSVTLVHCDGSDEIVELDADGRWDSTAVPSPGPTRVHLPSQLDLDPTERATRGRRVERKPDDISVPRKPTKPVTLPSLGRQYRIVVSRGRHAFSC